MSVKFLGATSASAGGAVSGSATLSVATPAFDRLQVGDFVFCFITCGGPPPGLRSFATIPAPTGWVAEAVFDAGFQSVYPFLHYVDNLSAETGATLFTASFSVSTVSLIALAATYRGVQQDLQASPGSYPFGFYAPDGSHGGITGNTTGTDVSVTATGPINVAFSRTLVHLGATLAGDIPHLADLTPLIAIRARMEITGVAAMLADVLEEVAGTTGTYVSRVGETLNGAIGLTRVLEPLEAVNDSYDTYKAKVMRRLAPPPYDARFGTPLGKLFTVIGGLDNDIGGLFGPADFLPDEE